MNISLPEALKSFVDQQVRARGYRSSSEYVRELIRNGQDRQPLRGLLLEGAASPPTVNAAQAQQVAADAEALLVDAEWAAPEPVVAGGRYGRSSNALTVRVGAGEGAGGRARRSGPPGGRGGHRRLWRCPPARPCVRALVVPETRPPGDASPRSGASYRRRKVLPGALSSLRRSLRESAMAVRRPTEETARLGVAIYERDIRAQIEVDHHGEYVAIDSQQRMPGCRRGFARGRQRAPVTTPRRRRRVERPGWPPGAASLWGSAPAES